MFLNLEMVSWLIGLACCTNDWKLFCFCVLTSEVIILDYVLLADEIFMFLGWSFTPDDWKNEKLKTRLLINHLTMGN